MTITTMTIRALKFSLLGAFFAFLIAPNVYAAANANTGTVIRWAGCGITKKAFMAELAIAYEAKTNIKIELSGGGATRGIRDTVGHLSDMGGTCRMTLPEYDSSELHATLHPVAWDALAVIVHKSNPVNNLTTEQIKGIYTGKITNWRQVGGSNARIKLYARKGKISGVGYAIRQYVFQDSSQNFKTKYLVKSSGPLEKAVVKDPYAMGITGVSSARKRDVKIIGFDGKIPTYDNVKSGQYGLYRPLYLVTGPSPSDDVMDFITFATSDEGKKVIRENGSVPYTDALNLMSKLLIYGFGLK